MKGGRVSSPSGRDALGAGAGGESVPCCSCGRRQLGGATCSVPGYKPVCVLLTPFAGQSRFVALDPYPEEVRQPACSGLARAPLAQKNAIASWEL
jgi:hypothetical protein